jgi:hypothetical protein
MESRRRSSVSCAAAAAAQAVLEQDPAVVEQLPPLQNLSIQGQGYGEASQRHTLAHDSPAGAVPSVPKAALEGPLGQGLLGMAEGSESADMELHVLRGTRLADVDMRQARGMCCHHPCAS